MKIHLTLSSDNVVTGYFYLASEKYQSQDGVYQVDCSLSDIIGYKSRLVSKGDGTYSIDNSGAYLPIKAQIDSAEETIRSLSAKISSAEQWFSEYDLQVSQYDRAVRLGEAPSIHIGSVAYQTFSALDADAKSKAAEIKSLRADLEASQNELAELIRK